MGVVGQFRGIGLAPLPIAGPASPVVDRRGGAAELADLTLVALPDPLIDTSPSARAKVGLTPATSRSLVGWGLRSRVGRGWYLDVPTDGAPVVVRVLEGTHHPSGQACPPPPDAELSAVFFHRRGGGEPRAGHVVAADLASLVAIPDADGEFLAHRFGGIDGPGPTREALGTLPEPGDLGQGSRRSVAPRSLRRGDDEHGSDPIFLVGAFVCDPAPDPSHTPVHEGQLGPHRVAALRTAREGYDLVLDVAGLLVDAPGPWGAPVAEVARRAADVLQARYPRLVAEVATAALSQTLDEADVPVMPLVGSGDATHDRLLASVWAAWAFGPRATAGRGRELVRAAWPVRSAAEVDRLLVHLLVTLHLGTVARQHASGPVAAAFGARWSQHGHGS